MKRVIAISVFALVSCASPRAEQLQNNLPDLVLSDIGHPGLDGIRGITILKKRYPELLIGATALVLKP